MAPLTSAQKVAASRRGPRAVRRPHVADPCPRCGVDLGGAGSVTARIALSSPARGTFAWECPSCRTRWTEPGGARAGSR